jgi:uncharacterized protein YwlG (UPF0340 family)
MAYSLYTDFEGLKGSSVHIDAQDVGAIDVTIGVETKTVAVVIRVSPEVATAIGEALITAAKTQFDKIPL